MTSLPGSKRPRARSSTKSSPENPTILPSIQRLLDSQTAQIKNHIKELEVKIAAEVVQIDKKLVELTKAVGFNAETLEAVQKVEIPKIQNKMEENRKNVQEELDRVNAYICRENLVFIGVPEAENENVETLLAKLFTEN